MSEFSFTKNGEEIAKLVGLDKLSWRLVDEADHCRLDPVLEYLCTGDHAYSHYDPEDVVYKVFGSAHTLLLPNNIEYSQFSTGVRLYDRGDDPDTIYWFRLTGNDSQEGRLFSVPETLPQVPLDSTLDSLILSGSAGLCLRGRPEVRRLLSKDGYRDFGFDSRVDAAAFVGAWVVSTLRMHDELRYSREHVSFTRQVDGGMSTVSLGGDAHGDFRIKEVVRAEHGAMTPVGRYAEFSPDKEVAVSGYHSVETAITETMLTSALLDMGLKGVRDLMTEFSEIIKEFMEADDLTGPGSLSGFADYGSSSSDNLWLYMYLENDYLQNETNGYGLPGEGTPLHQTPVLPQSSIKFNIYGDNEGIIINNSDGDDVYEGIAINRCDYGKLFRALLQQAQKGLGRSSARNHIEVLQGCDEMLREAKR